MTSETKLIYLRINVANLSEMSFYVSVNRDSATPNAISRFTPSSLSAQFK